MLNLGLLGFAQPWLLIGLLGLPVLWLLLRVTPPAPKRIAFPALVFLLGLVSSERTPARTPWWLLLLRLLIAALVILALAGPLWNPAPRLGGSGPLLIVLDDGWAAAPDWDRRLTVARNLVDQAGRDGREVVILTTAPGGTPAELRPQPAAATLERLATLQPHPWSVDRAAARDQLEASPIEAVTTVWISDVVADRPDADVAARSLADALRRRGPLSVLTGSGEPVLVHPGESRDTGLDVQVMRSTTAAPRDVTVAALGGDGETLGNATVKLEPGAAQAAAVLDLPLELRNRIARLEVVPPGGAGGVYLFDERWRRRAVGIVGARHETEAQPLLSEAYFLERAMAPFAEVRLGSVPELLDGALSMIVLPDTGIVEPEIRARLDKFMDDGGLIVRFAGSRLAASGDTLVPVRLRSGDRMLGGVLSWEQPLALAPFDPQGPFAGLTPPADARVSRQVLAEPGPDLAKATLASLTDGTPLVTTAAHGKGRLVLIHTTANAGWTTLPLSGLFVDMLKALLELAPGAGALPKGELAPHAVLDGFGVLAAAKGSYVGVPAADLTKLTPGPAAPPGLWAPVQERAAEDESEAPARLALNVQQGIAGLTPLDRTQLGAEPQTIATTTERDLAPPLLLIALLLAIADLALGYILRGFAVIRQPAATAAMVLLALTAMPVQAADDAQITELTRDTRLAYVLTGLADVDDESKAGLTGLTRVLAERTAVEAADPYGVDIENDELALFPLLYWPVPPEHPDLSPKAVQRVEDYLRQGGMILFDTRDGRVLLPGQDAGGPGEARLRELLGKIDLPPLEPVPADHVLGRSFYLLQDFPGRWAGQPVWIDQASVGINDGVSGVIVGANEWAGAWAEDQYGEFMYPVVPGGEAQREMARRFGVNVVMYALTGNYKTDQVHVPALLERLGQ
ncbi:MAG: DUF4159 domain-containing protein [Geminicoccaceae bacterium]